MQGFWEGFEKRAWHRVGKDKDFLIVGRHGESADKISKRLVPVVFNQPAVNGLMRMMPEGEGRRAFKEGLRSKLEGIQLGGTFGQGKKGRRNYINRATARDKASGLNLREIVHHEGFHTKAPLGLGHSELLAHAYGGLKSQKGKNSLKDAVRGVGHLFKTRPGRGALEAALATGALYGTKKSIDKVKGAFTTKKEAACSSIIDKWRNDSGEVKKGRERNDTDPVELSSGFTPDTYRRGAFT